MNKIRIIDLLNKIAKGEEVPEKIIFHNLTYKYEKDIDYCTIGQNKFFLMDFVCICEKDLNKEIKILDDIKEIEEPKEDKIKKIYHCETSLTQNEVEIFIIGNLNQMVDKINEIIDYINKEE